MLTHTRIIYRLGMLLLCNILLMGILGALGIYGAASIRENLRTVYEDRTIPLSQTQQLVHGYYETRLAVLAGLNSDDPKVVAEKLAEIQARKSTHDALWQAFMSTSLTPEEAALGERTGAAREAYDAVWPEVFARLTAGNRDGARDFALSRGAETFATLSNGLDELAKLQARVAGEEYQRANEVFETEVYLLVGVVLVAMVFGAILAFVIARSITRPLGRIIGVMEELTKGNLAVAVAGQERRDEVGSVAKAVGVFKDGLVEAERLRGEQQAEQMRQVERGQKMEAAIGDFDRMITEVIGAVSSAATQLQSTAQSLSATAEETSQQSNAVAAASEQMTQNVQTVASATEELAASIGEIGAQVNESSRIVSGAVEQAADTNGKVGQLAEAAQKIGDVVTLINEIAAQTNLLALNATIEAARAGEAGKGFAVVASEVKNLASQTSRATDEIAAQVRAIQESTEGSARAIVEIGQTINRVNEISTTIASAVEEQSAATQEISRNVQQTSTGTAEVTSNIVGVTQASQQTSAGASQVLSAADELASNGTRLRNEVESFLRTVRSL
ncbi:methyl-accepting chemotaxis sensory transducer with Pas/Pac sensor [Dongia mobilis]|uniref:Methyl-accepting chemotaxis sensory transducer with Pas/Pac sensor n=1 Tax=Dongia mobilis TaxID=578943 RepID=A0A4R6X075_9PROT|nr:methyl-accepting chemotaxis sensory transducer with Pas/Pac sensor [Dongia mobilis]